MQSMNKTRIEPGYASGALGRTELEGGYNFAVEAPEGCPGYPCSLVYKRNQVAAALYGDSVLASENTRQAEVYCSSSAGFFAGGI